MHLPIKFGANIFIQCGVNDIFPKFKMAAAAIMDFQLMWIWPFRRVDSVVFVFCTKFSPNICYSHWDRCSYASEVHLMTSRELTSGFDSWSCGYHRMDMMHLPIKFGADIFIHSNGGRRHLGFVGEAMGPPTKAHSWRVLPVKISSWPAK